MGAGKRYSQAFKEKAVQLSSEGTKSITQVARDLGIEPALLRQWRRELAAAGPKALKSAGNDQELEQLRGELRRVTWELDFLKEAAAFLAKTSRSGIR